MFNCWIKNCTLHGRIADENDSDLRYSEVSLKWKNKTLVKILGVVNTERPLQVKYWGSRPLQPLRRWRLCLSKDDSDFPCSERRHRPICRYIATIRRAGDCSGHIQSTSVRVRFWVLYKYDEFSKFGKYKPKGACIGQCDPCKLSWLSYNMLEAVQDEHVVTIVTYIRNNVYPMNCTNASDGEWPWSTRQLFETYYAILG